MLEPIICSTSMATTRSRPPSNYRMAGNFQMTVDYCAEHFDPEHLLGIQMNVWQPTLEECRERHIQGLAEIEQTLAGVHRG